MRFGAFNRLSKPPDPEVSAMSNETMLFFDSVPACLSLYEAFEAAVLNRFPDASVRTQKTQISFYGPGLFACVSLPRRKIRGAADAHIIVTFGLAYRLDSPRIGQAVQPAPGRWTHHVILRRAEEIDEELLGWIAESHSFALFRKK